MPCGPCGRGSPWTCSAQQNANYESTGKKMHRSHSCQEATGKVFFLSEGVGMCAAPSDTRSEGWVSTSTLSRVGVRVGSAALIPLPISRQDLACARQVRAWDWWDLRLSMQTCPQSLWRCSINIFLFALKSLPNSVCLKEEGVTLTHC